MGNVAEYKSSVFSMLMDEPEYALDVYNSLNGTNYSDPKEIKIIELERTIMLSMRHDAAFIIDYYLNVYEHQSTINPNMPLRCLFYVTGVLKEFLEEFDEKTGKKRKVNIYSTKQIKIPNPHFVVFYNGEENTEEYKEIKLSDAFVHQGDLPELELTCTIYNINSENSHLKNCKVLHNYMYFVNKTRDYISGGYQIRDAVERAVNECINGNVLSEFFRKRRSEVINAMALDYTWTELEKLNRIEALEEGRNQGLEEGRNQGLEEGRSQGLEEGRSQGLEEGRNQGLEEGRSQGLEEGRSQGLEEGRSQGLEEGRNQGVDIIVNVIKRLKLGESDESIVNSGVDEEILNRAKDCL